MPDNQISYSAGLDRSDTRRLGAISVTLLMVGVLGYYALGSYVLPFWVVSVIPIFFFGVYYTSRHFALAVSMLTFTLTLVQLKPEKGVFSIYDAFAGALICLLLGGIIWRRITSYDKFSINSSEYLLFIVYFFWIMIVGVENLLSGKATFVAWFRDVLLFSPLLAYPALILLLDLKEHRSKRDTRIFYSTMVLLAILCFLVSVVKVRSSFLAATYLFEASYGGVNLVNGPCMLFVFFNLFLTTKGKKRYWYIGGVVLAIATIALAHNRTMLVLGPAGIFLTPFFLKGQERKQAIKVIFWLTVGFGVVIAILYVSQPFIRIVLDYFLAHILSSSNLKTDASLIGRYVEWRHIWASIENSPITGYGIGGTYHTYNWFGGWFYESAYTHNGYLGILHKGGVVGFLLLALSYGGFVIKGIRLLRRRVLTGIERAIIRGGLSTLILLIVATNTFNMFAHRDVLLYVGIIWGYFIYMGRHTALRPEYAAREALAAQGDRQSP